MIIRTKYTRPNGTVGIRTSSTEPSKTNPNYKDEVDVNNIINRFLKTGQLTHVSHQQMAYIDQSATPPDLQSTIHFIKNQNELYQSLNKKSKNRFPTIELFLEFAENPANQEELQQLLGHKKTTIQTTKKEADKESTPSTPPTPPTPNQS